MSFDILRPKKAVVAGSFLLGTMMAPGSIDLAFEFPMEMLGIKDELNYTYLYKRATLLMAMAEALSKAGIGKLSWEAFRGHSLKPILVVQPENEELEVRIHLVLPLDAIKRHRFGPGAALIRPDIFLSCKNCMVGEDVQLSYAPSPLYNALILADMLTVEHLKLLHRYIKNLPALEGAIKLVKAWIRSLGYGKIAFSPSGFQLSMILVYLLEIGHFEAAMNELQLFKSLLQFVSSHDFTKMSKFTNLDFERFVPKDCLDKFTEASHSRIYAAMLLEPVAGMNILFDWTTETTTLLRRDAVYSLAYLDAGKSEWQDLFLKDLPFADRFDKCLYARGCNVKLDPTVNQIHYFGEFHPQVAKLKLMGKKLRFGLGNRIKELVVIPLSPAKSNVKEPYNPKIDGYVILLQLDREESQRLVDLGPFAGSQEAKAFQLFWKGKSELRRFLNSTVCESVVWERFKENQHLIVNEIITFIAKEHLQIEELRLDVNILKAMKIKYHSHEKIEKVIGRLSKTLKQINCLPLSVARCEALSSNGRLTALEPRASPVELLIYLETSSRWPTDYFGLLHAKQVFMAKISEALQERLDVEIALCDDSIELKYDDWEFKCYLYQESQISLTKSSGLNVSTLELKFNHLPQHTRAISTLSRGNSLFAISCQCLKWFVSQQRFANHIPEELLELIVARVFLQDNAPNSILAAFYHACRIIAEFPWDALPLLVEFNTIEDDNIIDSWKEKTRTKFLERAKKYVPFWIVPSYEQNGNCCVWSKMCTVNAEDLAHLQSTCRKICRDIAEMQSVQFQNHPCRPFTFEINTKSNLLAELPVGIFDGQEFLEGFFIQGLMVALQEKICREFPNLRLYRGSGNIVGFAASGTNKELRKIAKSVKASFGDFALSDE